MYIAIEDQGNENLNNPKFRAEIGDLVNKHQSFYEPGVLERVTFIVENPDLKGKIELWANTEAYCIALYDDDYAEHPFYDEIIGYKYWFKANSALVGKIKAKYPSYSSSSIDLESKYRAEYIPF